jgi:hypothetical protein
MPPRKQPTEAQKSAKTKAAAPPGSKPSGKVQKPKKDTKSATLARAVAQPAAKAKQPAPKAATQARSPSNSVLFGLLADIRGGDEPASATVKGAPSAAPKPRPLQISRPRSLPRPRLRRALPIGRLPCRRHLSRDPVHPPFLLVVLKLSRLPLSTSPTLRPFLRHLQLDHGLRAQKRVLVATTPLDLCPSHIPTTTATRLRVGWCQSRDT